MYSYRIRMLADSFILPIVLVARWYLALLS